MHYEVVCNGARWKSKFPTVRDALRAIGQLADGERSLSDLDNWTIKIVKQEG